MKINDLTSLMKQLHSVTPLSWFLPFQVWRQDHAILLHNTPLLFQVVSEHLSERIYLLPNTAARLRTDCSSTILVLMYELNQYSNAVQRTAIHTTIPRFNKLTEHKGKNLKYKIKILFFFFDDTTLVIISKTWTTWRSEWNAIYIDYCTNTIHILVMGLLIRMLW